MINQNIEHLELLPSLMPIGSHKHCKGTIVFSNKIDLSVSSLITDY